MNRLANGILIVTSILDVYRLENRRQFAKFTKLYIRQTFPLYGMLVICAHYAGITLNALATYYAHNYEAQA